MDMAADLLGGRRCDLGDEAGGQVNGLPCMHNMDGMLGGHIDSVCTGMAIRGQSACRPVHRKARSYVIIRKRKSSLWPLIIFRVHL